MTSDPRIGVVLDGRYRIVSVIASGSMGAIYRGERLKLGRAVAIKVLHTPLANQERFLQRFEIEAKALSRLGHPNCISIIDFGVADAPYLVMEYIHGQTLKELIEQRPLPAPRTLHIFRQVLAGLAHAHGHGITHRDVKPGNVMLTEATGTGDHIRILDFGLAKLHNAALAEDETGSAKVMGTPFYMSPEQASGKEGDVRSDLYSAGVMLFEMLTGQKPFDSEEMLEVLNMHVEHPPPLLRSAARGQKFSEELEAVVQKALAKKPAHRYQAALEFAAALDATPEAALPLHRFHAQTKPPLAGAGTAELPLPENRRPRLGWLVLLLLAAAGATAAWFYWLRPAGPSEEHRASPPPVVDAAPRPSPRPDAPHLADARLPDGDTPRDTGPTPDGTAPDGARAATEPAADTGVALPRSGLTRVTALLQAKRHDEAITVLKRLRARARGKNAYVDYLLGKLYFDKHWWTVGMKHYSAAIRRDPAYRRRGPLIRNLLTATIDSKTAARAEQMLLREIGRAAVPHLTHAAKHHPVAALRKQAARYVRRLR